MDDRLRSELPQLLAELTLFATHAGAIERGREFWTGLAALNPDHAATRLLDGMLYTLAGSFEKAEASYRSILNDDADHVGARTFLAESLIGQKRWREAEEVLDGVTESGIEDPAVTYASELKGALEKGLFQRAASAAAG